MGGHGFLIHLSPRFRDAVAKSEIDQTQAEQVIQTFGLQWLQKCGFGRYHDPENYGFQANLHAIPSKETRPAYGPRDIRVSWGEWGLEHITVPGNACGLDLGDGFGSACGFHKGRSLLPHNVDSWSQVMLLLVTFTWFANTVILGQEYKKSDADHAGDWLPGLAKARSTARTAMAGMDGYNPATIKPAESWALELAHFVLNDIPERQPK